MDGGASKSLVPKYYQPFEKAVLRMVLRWLIAFCDHRLSATLAEHRVLIVVSRAHSHRVKPLSPQDTKKKGMALLRFGLSPL